MYQAWAALTVASIVSLTSLVSSFDDGVEWSREQKWTVAVTAISLVFGFFAFCFHLVKKEMFAATHYEHATVSALGIE
jgi:hypothetical protein